ncbi:hypothetical protein [Bdellovibrio sp. HCB209]|uniref:hypothetical protein n=1 Tax=Bdellovibrio sp. HCB209 TaxID=3394354 RepID=UPI0039B509EC
MKQFKLLLLAFAVAPSLALAALNLPAPEVLVTKAATNRIALREVIMDLDLNISEMRDAVTFDKYFAILGELQKQANRMNMDAYYPQAVESLGLHMVSNGMRWLDLSKDPSEKVQYYASWMDADALGRLLSVAEYQIEIVKDPTALKKVSANIDSILPVIDAKSGNLPYIPAGFRRLQSDIAVNMLKGRAMTADENLFWVSQIKLSSAMSEYLDFMNQAIYSIAPANKAAGHAFLAQLLLLNQQATKLSDNTPAWLIAGLGDSTVETLLRMVRFEEPMTAQEFTTSLNSLATRQLQGMAQTWMAQEKIPSGKYSAKYLELTKILIEQTRSKGLAKESDDMAKWIGVTAAPVLAKEQKIEGEYLLTDNKGRKWHFTVATARENMLVAALSMEGGVVYKPFFNVAYNLQGTGFVASERYEDLDHDQNPPIKFSYDNGVMTVVDPFGRDGLSRLQGKKVQEFNDMWKTAVVGSPYAEGIYEGYIYPPTGKPFFARVIVTAFNGYTMGRIDSSVLTVDLNIGSKGNDGVIIMTSGRRIGSSWVQLRGNLTDKGMNAYLVVGGKGQAKTISTLKRVGK